MLYNGGIEKCKLKIKIQQEKKLRTTQRRGDEMMNDEIVGLEDCDTRIVNAFLKTRDIQRDLAPLIDNGDGTTSAERIEEVMAALLLFTRNWDIEIKEELFQHVQQYMDIILEMGA